MLLLAGEHALTAQEVSNYLYCLIISLKKKKMFNKLHYYIMYFHTYLVHLLSCISDIILTFKRIFFLLKLLIIKYLPVQNCLLL